MISILVQRKRVLRDGGRNHAHRAADAPGNRHGDLVEADRQRIAVPGKVAWADGKGISRSSDGATRPLRHRPALAVLAVDRDIDRAMIERIGRAVAPRQGVVRREHAADEGNDGDAVLAVVTQRIDIPPGIAVLGDWLIEPRSSIRQAAAERPDSAAIGTPGPGWVLPPARYNPGTLVRAPGR